MNSARKNRIKNRMKQKLVRLILSSIGIFGYLIRLVVRTESDFTFRELTWFRRRGQQRDKKRVRTENSSFNNEGKNRSKNEIRWELIYLIE